MGTTLLIDRRTVSSCIDTQRTKYMSTRKIALSSGSKLAAVLVVELVRAYSGGRSSTPGFDNCDQNLWWG